MKDDSTKTYTLAQLRRMKSQTDWDRLTQEEAADIEPVLDDDEGGIRWDWTRAVLVEGVQKQPISLRLDPDVLEFFKSGGPGYQTRINAVLRAYMQAQKARGPKSG